MLTEPESGRGIMVLALLALKQASPPLKPVIMATGAETPKGSCISAMGPLTQSRDPSAYPLPMEREPRSSPDGSLRVSREGGPDQHQIVA